MSVIQKNTNTYVGKDVGRRKPWNMTDGKVNWCTLCGKQNAGSQKLEIKGRDPAGGAAAADSLGPGAGQRTTSHTPQLEIPLAATQIWCRQTNKEQNDHMTQQFHSWVHIYERKTVIWKDTRTLMFTAAWFTVLKIWKQPKCPFAHKCIQKMCVHTQGNTTQSQKKQMKEISPFATTWMDLEGVILWNKSNREKQTL